MGCGWGNFEVGRGMGDGLCSQVRYLVRFLCLSGCGLCGWVLAKVKAKVRWGW